MSDPSDLTLSRRQLLEATAAGVAIAGTMAAGASLAATAKTTVSRHIVDRLRQHGADRLFGVPGATCDPLFSAAREAELPIVVTSSDLEAGYAADGYARVRGIALVSVTYGVGTMGLLSVVGGAYAERSPLVVINGGPSAEDLRIQREHGSLFSHSTGRDASDLAMFREVTAYAERIERAQDLPGALDAALRASRETRRPVYVEVPKHLWTASVDAPGDPLPEEGAPLAGDALADSILGRLRAGSRPALLLGSEVARYGLADEVTALVERLRLPWASTYLGKSAISERTAGFVGVYSGSRSVPAVRRTIEESDALLAIGCIFGRQYRQLVTERPDRLVRIGAEGVRIGSGAEQAAALRPLVAALRARPWQPPAGAPREALAGLSFDQRRASMPAPSGRAPSEPGLGFDELLREISGFLDETFVVLTDTSLSMVPAAELDTQTRGSFLCNGVWQSIGWSAGAAAGVGLASGRRPVVLCGDGGFQMTAQALSTLVRQRVRAVVVVLDNGRYGIEQWLLDPGYFARPSAEGLPHLALNRWNYADLARSLGVGTTATVETLDALRSALASAKDAPGPALIAATVRPHDLPAALGGNT